MSPTSRRVAPLLLLAAALAAGCAKRTEPGAVPPVAQEETIPPAPDTSEAYVLTAAPPPGRHWLECQPGSGDAASARIGPAGGVLQLHGHALQIPAGALDREVEFTLREPTTTRVLVRVTPSGQRFLKNAALTVSWEGRGCSPPPNPDSLSVFRVNPSGPHDDLGGTPTGKGALRTDRLDHTSGYALVTN